MTITRALLSVSDKTGIVAFAETLAANGVEILSTGGTARLLKENGIAVTDVSEHTGFPEIMDGRVKTLHPAIHGGVLARRDVAEDQQAMQAHAIAPIDLVVVNLYPFESTAAAGAAFAEVVEQIDIGGPAMIRAAAKNHAHVTVVVDPQDYDDVGVAVQQGVSPALNRQLAAKAFARCAAYDSAIAAWFARQEDAVSWPLYLYDGVRKDVLRYGENPHQSAAFYVQQHAPASVAGATQHHGKALSYNNINDTDAAFQLVSEFDEPAVVIVKHANPCGVAIAGDMVTAYRKAFACDPTSAYGGIIAVNRPVEPDFVEALGTLFLEVVIAPDITPEALAMLQARKNLRILTTGGMPEANASQWQIKSVSGGYLVQQRDETIMDDASLSLATRRKPTLSEMRDLRFAFTVCKHVKSNAIVLAKEGATVGIGAGQMSRVDSVRLAGWKAEHAALSTVGSVLASDAFFPFDDNVHHAAELGVVALIQPGGSIRDEEVTRAADHYGMAMVLTGTRHFAH